MRRTEFLKTVRKEIHYIFARNEIEKELEQHLNESVEDLLAEGLSIDEAEAQAVLQMGDAKEIGRELNKVHNPLIGYLIVLTRCILFLMIFPIYSILWIGAHDLAFMIFPSEIEEYVEKYEVNMSIDTPMHYLKVGDLYFCDDNECSITFRSFQKVWKARANNTFDVKLVDQAGNTIPTASTNYFAAMTVRHDVHFTKDEMNSVFIHTRDGQVLEISLEEET